MSENEAQEAEPKFRFPYGTLNKHGEPEPEQRSDYLGVTVRFIDPLLGRHEQAYRAIIDRKDGTLSERRFAAALTIIENITFDDDEKAVNVKNGDYADLPIGLLRWIGAKAFNYFTAVTLVPFN